MHANSFVSRVYTPSIPVNLFESGGTVPIFTAMSCCAAKHFTCPEFLWTSQSLAIVRYTQNKCMARSVRSVDSRKGLGLGGEGIVTDPFLILVAGLHV